MKKICIFISALIAVACTVGNSDEIAKLEWAENDSVPAWKGERKNFCAGLDPSADLTGLTLKLTDLSGDGGVIDASQIKAQFVSYVMADVLDTTRYGQCGYRPKGKYDSLYVAEILDIVTEKDAPAGLVQPIWITVAVPQDAAPGTYRGKLKVKADGGYRWTLPLELTVVDEVLPEPKDWKFHLDLWQNPYAVARYNGVELWSKEHFDAMRPVMEMLASAGQKVVTATIIDRPWNGQTEDAFGSMVVKTKFGDGHWEYDFSIFDKWVEYMFSLGIDSQINCYSMIPWKLTFDYIDGETGKTEYVTSAPGEKEYAYYWTNFLSAFASHLKEKGWFEKTMIAMDERPVDAMVSALDVIMSAEPDFKVSLAGNYHPELADKLADYSIALRQEFPEDVVAERKASGMKSTYYTCCAEGKPNIFVASEPLEGVWLGWHALARGLDGYLRWAYNSWTVDPLKDTRFRTWPAGDCFVVYPDGRSSVHFEKLIEGIQDYEKAHIMIEKWTEAGDTGKLELMQEALGAFTLEELLENGPEEALNRAKALIN